MVNFYIPIDNPYVSISIIYYVSIGILSIGILSIDLYTIYRLVYYL